MWTFKDFQTLEFFLLLLSCITSQVLSADATSAIESYYSHSTFNQNVTSQISSTEQYSYYYATSSISPTSSAGVLTQTTQLQPSFSSSQIMSTSLIFGTSAFISPSTVTDFTSSSWNSLNVSSTNQPSTVEISTEMSSAQDFFNSTSRLSFLSSELSSFGTSVSPSTTLMSSLIQSSSTWQPATSSLQYLSFVETSSIFFQNSSSLVLTTNPLISSTLSQYAPVETSFYFSSGNNVSSPEAVFMSSTLGTPMLSPTATVYSIQTTVYLSTGVNPSSAEISVTTITTSAVTAIQDVTSNKDAQLQKQISDLEDENKSLTIALAIIAAVLGVVLLIVILFIFIRQFKSKRPSHDDDFFKKFKNTNKQQSYFRPQTVYELSDSADNFYRSSTYRKSSEVAPPEEERINSFYRNGNLDRHAFENVSLEND